MATLFDNLKNIFARTEQKTTERKEAPVVYYSKLGYDTEHVRL